MTEFKHTIGDALYELYVPYDSGDEETVMYPIVKRTDHYVYINGRSAWRREGGKQIRFSIAELEATGRAWNAANRMSVNTRPLPHWPLMPAVVTKPEQQAITP